MHPEKVGTLPTFAFFIFRGYGGDGKMMSERGKAYYAILALYQQRFKLEKLPRTPKIEKKIEKLRNLEEEWKQAMRNPDFVRRLEESAVREAMERSEKYRQEQQRKRGMRKGYNGFTQEELLIRDQTVFQDFRKSRLTMNNFANKYANKYQKKYKIKPTTIRRILSKAVGNLPG